MELHEHLYALGLQVGRDVFDDPDGFRGVLDDFLDESDATTGDINLLVDALRLGAFRSMLTTLDSGADAARAVEEAGARLARDRGSSDAAGAQWALAVLGFAVGRVGESDVRRFRTATGSIDLPPGPAATQLPPVPGAAPPPYQSPGQPPHQQSSPPAPTQVPSYQPPQHQPAPSYPGASYQQPQPGSWPAPGQPGHPSAPQKSRTGLIIGVVATVVAVAVAIGLALAIVGGDDDTDRASDESTSEPTSDPTTDPTTEPTSEPTTDPTSEPTSEPTTEPTAAGAAVSDEAAAGYGAALLAFSDDFSSAGNKLQKATTRDDLQGALEASRQMRIAIYDLDLKVRDLDLAPVEPEVNVFLEKSGLMISQLDETYEDASSAVEVSLGVASLPSLDYTNAFQAVADAIDASRAAG